MGYVRTAGMSTVDRRRRRRTALVLTGLLVVLALVFAYAVAYYQGWVDTDEGSVEEAVATSEAPPNFEPSDVTVNVYNSSGETGLAGRTSEAFNNRGFSVNNIANDPQDADVEFVELRFGPEAADKASWLQAELLPEAQLVEDDRDGQIIDVALGTDFSELPPQDE